MYSIDVYQLEFIHRTMRDVLKDVEDEFGSQTITSLYRIDDSGVHGQLPLRGVDLRCRERGYGQTVIDWINSKWQYDPARPEKKVAIAHGLGYNYHIHLQVHHSTVRRS